MKSSDLTGKVHLLLSKAKLPEDWRENGAQPLRDVFDDAGYQTELTLCDGPEAINKQINFSCQPGDIVAVGGGDGTINAVLDTIIANKVVLIPDERAGCSLADSITPEDVRGLRARYPGVPIVTYVNTSAAVKAESDVCCTSGNAKKIVEGLGVPRVIMIPDEYLARNIAAQTDVEIITWNGHCEVHELFSPSDITDIRDIYADVTVIAHPECPPDVIAAADFSGSTAEMVQFVADHRPARVALVTECSMGDNVAVHYPEIDFVKPCNLCPHMKRITLKNIRRALETMSPQVHVNPALVPGARASVERMLAIK